MSKKRKKSRIARVERRRNRLTMVFIMLMVCGLLGVLSFEGSLLKTRIAANDTRIETLNDQIDEEKSRTTDIENQKAYMQTEEYIEQAAREKLGLVKDNEIIFRASDS